MKCIQHHVTDRSTRALRFFRVACALPALALAAALPVPGAAQTAVTIGAGKDPNLAAQIVIARDKGFFKEAGSFRGARFVLMTMGMVTARLPQSRARCPTILGQEEGWASSTTRKETHRAEASPM